MRGDKIARLIPRLGMSVKRRLAVPTKARDLLRSAMGTGPRNQRRFHPLLPWKIIMASHFSVLSTVDTTYSTAYNTNCLYTAGTANGGIANRHRYQRLPGCAALITFNKQDFLGCERFGVRLLTPAELLREIGVLK